MTDKAFKTADVLGAVTGVLLAPINGVYEVCSHMAGESVFTHQLPRVGRECYAALVKIHPWLAIVKDEAKQVTPENYCEWLRTWEDRYGPEISCPVMRAEDHESIDPPSELAKIVHPDRIVIIVAK